MEAQGTHSGQEKPAVSAAAEAPAPSLSTSESKTRS
uniref:Uncharacterized protein n=1 Tax=Arundo donax TaxID=35708 RepID=A0A0A9GIM6_ARUDO